MPYLNKDLPTSSIHGLFSISFQRSSQLWDLYCEKSKTAKIFETFWHYGQIHIHVAEYLQNKQAFEMPLNVSNDFYLSKTRWTMIEIIVYYF